MHHHHHQRTRFGAGPRVALGAVTLLAAVWSTAPAQAQTAPPTASAHATAQQVAQQGVALSELAPNAPERYTVQRGDTLWGIAGLYLSRPWRWPELWGMNLSAIANPHLIYPGQTLYLDRQNGFARLRTGAPGVLETVRISPRIRSARLSDTALPTLKPHLIEPFLAEPLVVDAQTLQQAPRMVGTVDDRVLMTTGDRAYARGDAADPLRAEPGQPRIYRIVRQAVALKDPLTQEVLGYEASYVGKAELVRGESVEETANGKGGITAEYVPATLDILSAKEEIRAGDRLLPDPVHAFMNYTPHAPQGPVDARVVSIYGGSAFANAAQNQVIAINLGEQDGIQTGHVLNLLTKGNRLKDTTDPARTVIKLPSESNGMVMVFRTFERVSYALILDVRTPVGVGDRLVNPD
ncbi:MAG: LysM peptidoglycan-binding domain-containing protein [Simplicispira sp.]|nr:LysM peptidoglycan-binding domain-containing protein [Simplicispira sp.]